LTGTVAPSRVNVSGIFGAGRPQLPHRAEELGETADALIGDRDDRIALAYARAFRRTAVRQPANHETVVVFARVHP